MLLRITSAAIRSLFHSCKRLLGMLLGREDRTLLCIVLQGPTFIRRVGGYAVFSADFQDPLGSGIRSGTGKRNIHVRCSRVRPRNDAITFVATPIYMQGRLSPVCPEEKKEMDLVSRQTVSATRNHM